MHYNAVRDEQISLIRPIFSINIRKSWLCQDESLDILETGVLDPIKPLKKFREQPLLVL